MTTKFKQAGRSNVTDYAHLPPNSCLYCFQFYCEDTEMTHTNEAVRAGGAWLATASFLMILALGLHGPIAPHLHDQMARIADGATRWAVSHWIAAAGLSLFAVTGLIVLTSHSRLTETWWTVTAWAVITVGSLWTMTTAVAETTVVADAAASGNTQTFNAWWAFSEGKANGFAFVALALAAVAGHEARAAEGATSTWSAWGAVVAGVVSFVGWALGMWFDLRFGSPVWLISSMLLNLWVLWFGVALVRSASTQGARQHAFI